ncbi:MAG TPA: SH3 domain-containing protein [Candidatus Blautia merdipullorum]|nr:SH3 domain-containing protein [Candidatus Blautia merdipullorum]
MLDDFREWLSDNLRYILLGLAILAVLLILFFGGRALIGIFRSDPAPDAQQTEQENNSSDDTNEEEVENTDTNALEENAYPEVNTLIESFYAAWGQKDTDAMKELTDNFSTTDETKVANATYIESYDNVQVYTKKGLDENSYVVFASYDLKFQGIDTPAPGLSELYVIKNENGDWLIHNDESDEEVQECLEKTRQEEDVQELISQEEEKYDLALESDEELNAYLEQLGEETNTALMADDGEMLTASQDCNVRADATTSSQILGRLQAGDQVKKLENVDDEWIKVEYEGEEAYIHADLLQ